MKVRIYEGMLSLIEKSGVGQALYHQKAMLKTLGINSTKENERDTDIVQINTVFPDSLALSLVSRMRGQKVVCYGHSTMEDFRNSFKGSNLLAPLFKAWIKLCYSSGDVIITPTEYSKSIIESYGIKKPVYAISNGIDTDFFAYSDEKRKNFRDKYNLTDKEKVVISIGHYIQRKGILDFIELAKSMPDIKFFWFGYTNPALIPSEITEAIKNAPDNLIFPGFVSQAELSEAYSGCDLFAFLSYEETEGIVILEALASSIPVLVRDIDVYNDWLFDGVNSYKGTNISQFRGRALEALYGDTESLRENGRKTAESKSISNSANKLMSVYNALMGKDKAYNKFLRINALTQH